MRSNQVIQLDPCLIKQFEHLDQTVDTRLHKQGRSALARFAAILEANFKRLRGKSLAGTWCVLVYEISTNTFTKCLSAYRVCLSMSVGLFCGTWLAERSNRKQSIGCSRCKRLFLIFKLLTTRAFLNDILYRGMCVIRLTIRCMFWDGYYYRYAYAKKLNQTKSALNVTIKYTLNSLHKKNTCTCYKHR